jgi:endonuclease YncB( thermonuclease family)
MPDRRSKYIRRNVTNFFVLYFLILICVFLREMKVEGDGVASTSGGGGSQSGLQEAQPSRTGLNSVLPGNWTSAQVVVDPAKGQLPRLPPLMNSDPYTELMSVPGNVRAENGAAFEIGSQSFKIAKIHAPATSAVCTNPGGMRWACGQHARMALRLLIAGKTLRCRPIEKGASEAPVDCLLGSKSIAAALIEAGWAVPAEPVDDSLAKALAEAQSKRAGAWASVEGVRP